MMAEIAVLKLLRSKSSVALPTTRWRSRSSTLADSAACSCCGGAFLVIGLLVRFAHQVVDDTPRAVEEAVDAAEAGLVPIEILIGRRHEQDVGAHGVGAVLVHHDDGRNHVALRLGHSLAVLVFHHALAQQVGERLVEVDHAGVAH